MTANRMIVRPREVASKLRANDLIALEMEPVKVSATTKHECHAVQTSNDGGAQGLHRGGHDE
eukprot:991902-Lingulodinium_polyedra.AAC.1